MNHLYPIFLKVHELNVLLVGGGFVGTEKLEFLLKSSPKAQVTVVSKMFRPEFLELAEKAETVTLIEDSYDEKYLGGKHLVIAATDDKKVNLQIRNEAKERFLLVNVADTPALCDFYLGGIVTKGNLKIAISTNGKSPTTAKRLRQLLEEVLPEEIDDLLDNLNAYRDTLKGDFEYKVKAMNEVTEALVKKR
ncbi:MAG TPA: siroheme synthase [Algoriphagus sp.]|jgi:precorrin-2 dehydrogenase/sirohydrochlorin ferrochelatase|uniref:precorrin-2 dehydrogenase/sirohydrochlorin ferrochelatase family protein n=1 Tax=unclassified Algoriphagus TaxID=2641541 RepID=UPI000C674A9A|nr:MULTISPECIES: bifunctional precorrin-2 dehydrogenase/sirohydrochlorin ferrochelatase [unclassified Algoriphagus]MAL12203.1 siroheme synthase [Algoriphagus sp.]MAN87141.1 siroheme synthase [Algoriphagus sp.]QYH40889.1 bifunctional precorrin-2 dehydrogenase/sirohydrochlorin ferrochelatase [Algoriphagus sp. NBT04N3]HAD51367.1 siroheme synthase [Algoriphagus sp.]HAH37586.1 siroheme synthase [Algoriphagus sp.]|tara:strand:- start:1163 stop:1738 length:576 start_codon:yes stop_codon:yes gene_type:complete